MSNRILSKKIKFPLSLRGTFPHVIARERSDRSNPNHSGFSLIELMVAVSILALVIFGIFLAFTTGFQGMADARDRTIATNYAQEAMENIKNMDFELITEGNLSIPEILDGKFTRIITIEENVEGSPNLKEVTTIVSWENRNGKSFPPIVTSMLVNKIEFTAGTASRILLYVYPYNFILPANDSAELTAVVKDAKGNTVTNWDKDITFTITTGLDLGYLETIGQTVVTKSPNKGYATVNYYSTADELGADEKGQVIIRAEVLAAGELGFDTTEIILTWGAVKIALTAPISIKTNENTTITASLQDAGGNDVTNAEAEITFTVTGEGTLTAPLTKATSGGNTSITLTTSNTPGVVRVIASASNLFSDSADIYVTGPPVSINVEVSPASIYLDGTAEVTVTLKDIKGVTVSAEELVNIGLTLSLDSIGQGGFSPALIPINTGSSNGNSTFTPTASGHATVQASDSAGKLTTGVFGINIVESLIADHIEVNASPSSIKLGEDLPSAITVVIKSSDNITLLNYNQIITFSTDKGSFSPDFNNVKTLDLASGAYQNGTAMVNLYSKNETASGIATITVTSASITPGSVEVGFYVEADHIELASIPNQINIFGKQPDTSTILATIKDISGTTVQNYVGTVTFSVIGGSAYGQFVTSGSTIVTVINGQASIDLRSKCSSGIVIVKATSTLGDGEIISDPLSVGVNDGGTRNIELVSGSVRLPANKKGVWFNILTTGGNLRIYNLKITSGTTAKLTEIKIDEVSVYTGSSNDNIVININPTLLSLGEHKIDFTYNASVESKNFNIILNADPDCGLLDQITFPT